MLFNSFEFAVFLTIVFTLYWTIFSKSAKSQNLLLLISGFIFYAFADWRFFFLLVTSAIFNYFLAKAIFRSNKESLKKTFYYGGILINVGLLSYFKYFSFIYESLQKLITGNAHSIEIIAPLGISFFTFQVLGYIIDVYNEEIEPEDSIFNFILYITYFPKLFAGPIERAQNFLPQIRTHRKMDVEQISDGLRQFLWGLFTKLVIADNAAGISNKIFDNYQACNGSTLLIGSFFYSFQVYCDFSGYSNMAIGVSKLFGIKLMQNFATPFFSTSISEYWKKWHISLSSWMMNYVFTPLSFLLRKQKKAGLIISIIITFMIVGLWHGASWTYLLFGFMHGCYFIPGLIKPSAGQKAGIVKKTFPGKYFRMIGLFLLVMLTMIIFRLPSVGDAFNYYWKMFSGIFSGKPAVDDVWKTGATLFFIIFMLTVEWFQKNKEHALQLSHSSDSFAARSLRWIQYAAMIVIILGFQGTDSDFIYFKF